ncbi:hypothetical protein SAY86_030625 [Trapa natans]|uniref:Uncharacterized protein n=1 Tax=Trapa natans TaxID=22666 RepID=A0AAN7M5F6_TRANT|nr:hypothetical protein SAY86_030625 [Trapa natans]
MALPQHIHSIKKLHFTPAFQYSSQAPQHTDQLLGLGMVGSKKKSSSFFSVFSSIFRSCCSGGGDDWSDDGGYTKRISPSDEDRGYWIAEPGIDRRASAFIAKFYASRATDPEKQTLAI